MEAFKQYAAYYDLLYKDKAYNEEAKYIHKLVQDLAPNTKSILNLGCGSGRHDIELAQLGYSMTGIDISEGMIAMAKANYQSLDSSLKSRLSFSQNDARTLELSEKFDAVISLFHVMSYQTTDYDLASFFDTSRKHLKVGGLFLFDCWFGPAVLADPPEVRKKVLQNHVIQVVRKAIPKVDEDRHLVDVHYDVQITELKNNSSHSFKETHHLRYLFKDELIRLLEQHGFQPILSKGWMMDKEPGTDTWYALFGGILNK